jgi:hypothetical protein
MAQGVATCWLDKAPVFAFGDGLLLIGTDRYQPHAGGILGLACDTARQRVISCGDDGKVVATDCEGQSELLFHQSKLWLDQLIVHHASGTVAVGAGRKVILLAPSKPEVVLQPQRAATSLAFSGDGVLLAVGHSAGVSLFRLSDPTHIWQEFPCAGGPLSVALDHAGAFLFAGLSEPALAGWSLADGRGFRMGGYPGKPRQLVWSSNAKALLTSGGPALLVWPMVGKDGVTLTGPMGQAAGVYRPRLGLMTGVATHSDLAATGWSDGGVDLVNMQDGSMRHLGGARPPKTLDRDPRALTTAIVSLAFRSDGKQVSWISETGSYATAAIQ